MNIPDFLPILSRGNHHNPANGACVMEMVSYLAGEEFSDHPKCVTPILGALAIEVNDWVSDDNRTRIAQLIPVFMNTNNISLLVLKARVQQEVLPQFYNWFSHDRDGFRRAAVCEPYSFDLKSVVHAIQFQAETGNSRLTNEEYDDAAISYLESVMLIVRDMKGEEVVDWDKAKAHISQKANA